MNAINSHSKLLWTFLPDSAVWRAVMVMAALAQMASGAERAQKRPYQIPAADAAVTLRQFVEQSGEQVLYLVPKVRGVTTNAVKGEYTARAALDLLLANTRLSVFEDSETGALMINRVAREKPPPAARPLVLNANSSLTTGTINGRVRNAVTGKYLNNARVSIKGTDQIVYTDSFGIYQISGVSRGSVVIEVFYTDLDVAEVGVALTSGGIIERNVDLTSVARYGQNVDTVKLNPYVVLAETEADSQSLAVNEQRFAANIKNVMAVDALGTVLGSQVGEFLKYIPGVTANFNQNDVSQVSIRGIGAGMTSITADGAPIDIAASLGSTRATDIRSLSLNDYSRVEITKVPTPANPADSLAGSVNLISKSAFERSRALLRYGVTLDTNSENLTFKKTPDSAGDRLTRKVNPSFNFDYTWPVTKNFGVVISGMHNNKFNEQHISQTLYATSGLETGASLGQPYLLQFQIADGPRHLTRDTLSLKADWRITPRSVLTFGAGANITEDTVGNMGWMFNTGAIGSPTPTTGVPLTFGDNFVNGATGRGTITQIPSHQVQNLSSFSGNLGYRFDDGKWRVDAAVNGSKSSIERNRDGGHYYLFSATTIVPVRVVLSDIVADRPGRMQAFTAANQEIDVYNIDNYRATTATDQPIRNRTKATSANLNVRRRLDLLPFPTAVQVGASQRVQVRDTRLNNIVYTFNGPDGNPSTIESLRPYLAQVYAAQDNGLGFSNIPWLSGRRLWDAAQQNPLLVSQTTAQKVAAEVFRRTNSEHIREATSSAYLQADISLFENRLRILTGVRYERTAGEGEGAQNDPSAVFLRNSSGTFALTPAGAKIRKPNAPAAGSLEELDLTLLERAAQSTRNYDGYYPSMHLTYQIRKNFQVRAAYARTYGRPNFVDIIPRTVINEATVDEVQIDDPAVVKGTITVRNSNLRPWTSDNLDLSVEYYTQQGGVLSAGVFSKEITDFFGTGVRVATLEDLAEVGITDSRYVGWNLSTKFNAGDARVSGIELNFKQSLREVGSWGRFFTVFANATRLNLRGALGANFSTFVPKTANWGATFEWKRLAVAAKWSHRGEEFRGFLPAFGPNVEDWFKSRTTLDLSIAYQITARLSIAASATDVGDVPRRRFRKGDGIPDYARQIENAQYGVNVGLGIMGKF